MGTYIAVLRTEAVRDVQFCLNAERDPMDDDSWQDMPDAEVYLNPFQGEYEDVLKRAADYAGTVPENIRLIQLAII